ncbi:efflux RND transporter periplasmic adaptor subunit [Steroidobacter flavus]|uniref:Efflux RND transporter periplasmic adaptor subunit n=1 Tax=Steroidobacter flavus TaxID=1842136 RepID=A0ABV8T0X9_9GAMM
MKKILAALAGSILIGALAVWGIVHTKQPPQSNEDEAPAEANTPGIVQLKPEQLTQAGIVVANLEPREVAREVKGYGRVIDTQPLLDLLAELRAAQATLEVSTKEYERVRALHANDQNASARALETASATVKRDQIQVETIRSRLGSAWGPAFIKSDAARLVQSLSSLEAVLIRVDLPVDESLKSSPATARVLSPFDPTRSAEARFLGRATMASAQTPGQGFLFLLQPNSFELRPEMGLITFLTLEGPRLRGVILPRSAIVRHQGQAWVYIQTGDGTFERKPVVLEHALDDGWFIDASAAPSGRVVVGGAQTLLSEELRPQIHLAD